MLAVDLGMYLIVEGKLVGKQSKAKKIKEEGKERTHFQASKYTSSEHRNQTSNPNL